MDIPLLKEKFARMGARLKFAEVPRFRRDAGQTIAVDIAKDRRGEFFDIRARVGALVDMDVIDVRRDLRHLLLLTRAHEITVTASQRINRRFVPAQTRLLPSVTKAKDLCGHDERSWFVAAVPESAGASTIQTAMEALKPEEVRLAQSDSGVAFNKRNRRKNDAFVRQGEWFFLPVSTMTVEAKNLLLREPLQRSGGKPHIAEFACRTGGTQVWVSREFPNGLPEDKYRQYMQDHPDSHINWRAMVRDASVFVKGRIRHPDHATVTLHCWHRVLMNTENRAKARANVVFLD